MSQRRFREMFDRMAKPIPIQEIEGSEVPLSKASFPSKVIGQPPVTEQPRKRNYVLPIAIGVGVISIVALVFLLRKK
jgi:hypothetical protein